MSEVDTTDRPLWWDPYLDECVHFLESAYPWGRPLGGTFERIDNEPNLLAGLKLLWAEETLARFERDQRVLPQAEYEICTFLLMFYADHVGIYAPHIHQAYLALTIEERDEDGEIWEIPNSSFDERECHRLWSLACGEIDRIAAAAHGRVNAPHRRKAGRPKDGIVADRRDRVASLYDSGTRSPRVIAEQLGIGADTVSSDLYTLRQEGRIV
ncbi:hypothetical protein [Aeoliella sp.]|uniref:hypothetical protein n=1 Tax=Aeoliella sp. TaxID=2795800 RepID=UPI003CCC4112